MLLGERQRSQREQEGKERGWAGMGLLPRDWLWGEQRGSSRCLLGYMFLFL